MNKNLPQGPGFYWARSGNHEWWNLIAFVWGEPPFMRIRTWNYADGTGHDDAKPYQIAEFGPMIAEESPKWVKSERS